MWSSRTEISMAARRNQMEYSYDGWNYRKATEEEDMYVHPITGVYIHPVHLARMKDNKHGGQQQQQQKQRQQLRQQLRRRLFQGQQLRRRLFQQQQQQGGGEQDDNDDLESNKNQLQSLAVAAAS